MKRKIAQRSLALIAIGIVLLTLLLLVARYGAALNPLDGCVFPEGRTSLRQDCHVVSWVWNE